MKVLVTGAGGMLATELLPWLEAEGHEVLGLTRGDADVAHRDSLSHAVRSFGPDWIFHLAAYTKVDDCETEIDHAYLVNAIGSKHVALAAAQSGAAVLAVSTDYVFPGDGKRPYREYDAVGPRSVYGASKWAGEQAIREILSKHMIVRTAWLYGRGGPNFIDTILRRSAAGQDLRVVDDQRGAPTWTRDLAGALLRLAKQAQYGTYHVTNSGDCTWFDLARYVLDRTKSTVRLDRTDSATLGRPAPRPAYSVLDLQMYEQATGDRMPPWKDAVDRYLETKAGRE